MLDPGEPASIDEPVASSLVHGLSRYATGELPRCAIGFVYCGPTRTMVNRWRSRTHRVIRRATRHEGGLARAHGDGGDALTRSRDHATTRPNPRSRREGGLACGWSHGLERSLSVLYFLPPSLGARLFPCSRPRSAFGLARANGSTGRCCPAGARAVLPVRSSLRCAGAAAGPEHGATSRCWSTRPAIGRSARISRERAARGARPDRRFA